MYKINRSHSEERVLSEHTCDSSESVVPLIGFSNSNLEGGCDHKVTSDDTPQTRDDGN